MTPSHQFQSIEQPTSRERDIEKEIENRALQIKTHDQSLQKTYGDTRRRWKQTPHTLSISERETETRAREKK
jgi:FPC/CPF motif-containing protein YcgG